MAEAEMSVKFTALSCAMAAKCQTVNVGDIEDLVEIASRLEANDPLHKACIAFATGYYANKWDPEKIAEIGHELQHQLDKINMPEPVGLDRKDIYG